MWALPTASIDLDKISFCALTNAEAEDFLREGYDLLNTAEPGSSEVGSARAIFVKLAERKDYQGAKANLALGQLYLEHMRDLPNYGVRAEARFLEVIELGKPTLLPVLAWEALRKLYLSGGGGLLPNPKQAEICLKGIKKDLEGENRTADHLLGITYRDHMRELSNHGHIAKGYFEKAAQSSEGHPQQAKIDLAFLYLEGAGGISQDSLVAKTMFEDLCEQGCEQGQIANCQLALIYLEGAADIPKNLKLAQKHFEKVARYGRAPSSFISVRERMAEAEVQLGLCTFKVHKRYPGIRCWPESIFRKPLAAMEK